MEVCFDCVLDLCFVMGYVLHNKTTLKQQLQSKKLDVGYLSVFGRHFVMLFWCPVFGNKIYQEVQIALPKQAIIERAETNNRQADIN